MKTPVLARQPSGCPVCGDTNKARITASGTWSQHKPGPGYDDGVRYGTVSAQPNCPASGKTRESVDDLLRTFGSWGDPQAADGDVVPDSKFHRRTQIQDAGDSIVLENTVLLGAFDQMDIAVRIRPEDTVRLIAELTAIAVAREILPDPAIAVRAAVAAELRALAKGFGDEAHRRNEIGDDDGGCSCADDDLSCHTTEAVAAYAHAQSRLNRRAGELDRPGVD